MEAFPVVALEAAAVGTPVVGYKVGGLGELIGECGVLVPSNDRDSLSEAIERVIIDGGLRDRLSACGRKRVEEHFSPSAMLEALKERYRAAAHR